MAKTKSEDKNKAVKPGAGKASYEAKDIYVLEGLEPVRKRPGMYIGSTGTDGLHHLVWEVVDNSIDEAMAGFAKNVTVELLPENKVAVTDDGRGIPVDTHKQTKKSALETVLTTLHAGGKFGGDSYKVSGGLHGVGVSVVNALSDWLRVEVSRDGGLFVQEYKRGKPLAKVKKIGSSKATGTKVIFSPDPEVFKDIDFSWKTIVDHLRQQAYLTRGVRINILDKRGKIPQCVGFYFDGGLLSFVKFVARGSKTLQDEIFHAHKEQENIEVEAAFIYIDDTRTNELSFANNIYTPDGGMHLTGFRSALTRSLNNYARSEGYLKEKEENLISEDTREGLVAIVSVRLREPQFEGQTKARLGNPPARTAVEAVTNDALKEFLEKRPSEARRIIEKVLLTAKARQAAKAAKETVLRKGAFEGLTLPGKLADCTSRNAEESEMFIVEGDSAGGTAKQGRDRRTQAILPLRGKPLNVEKARIDKMLANAEMRALVVAMGTAIAEEFDISKLRYHKIILMSDADVDGAHIRTLLLTFFYRYFKKVVEGGFIYIAQPPLYRVQAGKEIRYAFSDNEKDKTVAEMQKVKGEKSRLRQGFGGQVKMKNDAKKAKDSERGEAEAEGLEGAEKVAGVNIQRYKGLGEMSAEQLWETTMNPVNRILRQVTIADASAADKLFSVLMGDDVEPRKKFIQTHAAAVRNLDV
ncbi:MAG: DNA topoisomerase (ATP-hydrolyzing) subunit B [Candidatus Liptonbacteria bacterium]|nr:DNA topoisomerase (ATP-hydrolyzing) subunit B [Candidatus Liptonbacteria bacterium]